MGIDEDENHQCLLKTLGERESQSQNTHTILNYHPDDDLIMRGNLGSAVERSGGHCLTHQN